MVPRVGSEIKSSLLAGYIGSRTCCIYGQVGVWKEGLW